LTCTEPGQEGLKVRKAAVAVLLYLLLILALPGCGGPSVIKIGVIAEITGSMPAVGKSCQTSAKLAVKKINDAGGVKVAGKKYKVELVIEDSASEPKKATSAAKKLIEQDGVLAIVGPNSSGNAIAAADVANKAGVLLIAPWSTNPKTTVDEKTGKPKGTVYRACFTDYFESEALGEFARNKLGAVKAAALYDDTTDVLKNQAQLFKKSFEANGGKVVAFETFKAGVPDYSAQLDRIKAAEPDILFLPSYYTDAATQVKQARAKGISATFLGSDAWSTPELIKMGGADIEGSYLCNHYSSDSPNPLTREFVDAYKAVYGSVPDDVAALTYDSIGLLAGALGNGGGLEGASVLEGMGKVRVYKGATGTMRFEPGSHDPRKSGVIIQIKNGKFNWFADVDPAPTE
jgi:branched-chain amino acid transport system substrate-binding protein